MFTPVLLVSGVLYAPIPPAAPAKPKVEATVKGAHVGSWRMTWGQGQGDVVFAKDGGYWCLWAGQQWLGTWHLEAGNKLVVTEGKLPSVQDGVPDGPIKWSIELDGGGIKGKGTHGDNKFNFSLGKTDKLVPEPLNFPKSDPDKPAPRIQ